MLERMRNHNLTDEELIENFINIADVSDHCALSVRAVYVRSRNQEWNFFMATCFVDKVFEEAEYIYPGYAFISKRLHGFTLKEFLDSLMSEGVCLSVNHKITLKPKKKNYSWNEKLAPSLYAKDGWPVRKYSKKIEENSNYQDSALVGHGMPFYPSSNEFLKEFMRMKVFHGSSDSRKGDLNIVVPDKRAKIVYEDGYLYIESCQADLGLVGETKSARKLSLSGADKIKLSYDDFEGAELYLINQGNEVLDYKSEADWEFRDEQDTRNKCLRDICIALIDGGENEKCEFKAYIDVSPSKSSKAQEVDKTVCAFSNALGGTLLIGVSDDGLIIGIEDGVTRHYKRDVRESIKSYIKDIKKQLHEVLKVPDCYAIESIELGGKHVITIEVERTRETNYYVHTREAFIRRGATSFRMRSMDERKPDNTLDKF